VNCQASTGCGSRIDAALPPTPRNSAFGLVLTFRPTGRLERTAYMPEPGLQPDCSQSAYNEVGQNYRKFLDWREKIVGGYVAILGGLGIGFRQSEGNCRFQSALLCAAILTSLAFWILNMRNSVFISISQSAGEKLESGNAGVYASLAKLRGRGRLTHGLAVNLLVSGVIAGSGFALWADRACLCKRGSLLPLALFAVSFVLMIFLFEWLGSNVLRKALPD